MKVGLIGHGKMGRGIMSVIGSAPFDVTVLVRTPEKAAAGNAQTQARLERSSRHGFITPEQWAERRQAIRFTADPWAMADRSLLLECLPEDESIKASFLADMERIASEDTVLATNTSSLSIGRLARFLVRPQNFCGIHFFHPVPLTGVVELIRGPDTRPATVDEACRFARMAGRIPVVVKDGPGSVLNGALALFYVEGLRLVAEGCALPSRVDRLAGTLCRIGPCESLDIIGLGFFRHLFRSAAGVKPEHWELPALLDELISRGRQGRSTAGGLYRYEKDMPVDESRDFYAGSRGAESPDESIRDRLRGALLSGFAVVVGRGLAEAADLDVGMKDVLGMPAGPLELIRSLGSPGLGGYLAALRDREGPRFDPGLARGLEAAPFRADSKGH